MYENPGYTRQVRTVTLLRHGKFALEMQNLFPTSSQVIQVHLKWYLSIRWKFCLYDTIIVKR